jgi:surface protein
MFRNFKSLNEINFHEFDLSKVTNMEAIFYGFGLKNIDLSHMDLSKVTNTNYMFQSNNKVENINFE